MTILPFTLAPLLPTQFSFGTLLLGTQLAVGATGEVTLRWNPSSAPDLGGYRVHYGLASRSYSTTIDTGKQVSRTIANLTPGRTYYFTATVYSDTGNEESSYSNEVQAAIPAAGFSASAVSGLAPFTVKFTDRSVGAIIERRWNFGDGSQSVAVNPTHSFNVPGTYFVRLAVQGPQGRSTSSAVRINVCCTTPIDRAHDLGLFTVRPCRLVDTRGPTGPLKGPALAAGTGRVFAVVGRCGIPETARSLSVNVAVTRAGAPGNVRLYPAGTALPAVSSINYAAGQTRSNSAIVHMGRNGGIAAFAAQASGTVHLILDVNGYFE